jgi:NAD-dependent deacetylase
MKKILVFSGAGISAESGIETFRSGTDGLWNNYNIMDVATPRGWKADKNKVLDFYNQRRKQLETVEPNLGHKFIAKLERYFDVTVVTQNVDCLHERAGSTNVIHLHGELTKVRSTVDPTLVYDWGYKDLNIGDFCEKGSQLRPHIVWFEENLDPKDFRVAIEKAKNCDICIVVGTSMLVSPANEIPFLTPEDSPLYYVDPSDSFYVPEYRQVFFHHIKEVGSIGMEIVFDKLILNV